MCSEVIAEKENPKVWKRSFVLFGFQFMTGLLIAAAALTLTYVIKIPPSIHLSSMPATIVGAYYYGYWEEKRNPGILDASLIKRVCKIQAIWQFIVTVLISLVFLIIKSESINIGIFLFLTCFLCVLFILSYWVTRFFIKKGIAGRQKAVVKQNQLSA